MTSRYVPINKQDMDDLLIEQMGFQIVNIAGTYEYVYERQVETKAGFKHPYSVRVYSSVDMHSGWTRENGTDAIRLVLWDMNHDEPIHAAEKRVYRTKGAKNNLRERARDLFREVMDPNHHCPCCNAHMVVRKGRNGNFLGCVEFRHTGCKGTRRV